MYYFFFFFFLLFCRLGSEHLKNLALSGIKNIHVIDMDTIDLTNLNRQFLFRMKDVGKGKAETAADFVMRRVPGITITPHNKRIQDMDDDFYRQFKLVICGLDNVMARRWINQKLHSLVVKEVNEDGKIIGLDPETVIPMIDGGTEAFKGQVQIFAPHCDVSCFECRTGLFAPPTRFQLCTLASKPRVPEHCIAWVTELQWAKERPSEKIDCDNPEHVQFIFDRASARAKEFGIEGVTYFLTLGVAKNIIPAVASTNAIISAACCVEALKLLTYRGYTLNNNLFYNGEEGVNAQYEFTHQSADCIVCGPPQTFVLEIPRFRKEEMESRDCSADGSESVKTTVRDFIEMVTEHPKLQLPGAKVEDFQVFWNNGRSLLFKAGFSNTEANLLTPLADWVNNDEELQVYASALSANKLTFRIKYTEKK